ncbi:MAG: prephenate dehydratase [Actinomycetota bacterium]|nr:prephenate dehydratase [Actinomycetota bacterium]
MSRPRVAFLGPAGTFTDEALRASSPCQVDELPRPTVHETVMAVQTGEADLAVVPIENSLEGGVGATLDALAGEAERVRIAGEVVHPVSHCLVAAEALELGSVERVVSHPQATAQCAAFLRERLPRAERVDVGSTAEAVRQVLDAGGSWAALASRLAAELYGAEVLAEGVEDHPHNRTRFVWLRPESSPSPFPDRGPQKTSIVFWGAGDASPGWLVAVLGELAERGVNLTRIESRPRRVRLGHYMFFCDLEGGQDEPAVREALRALAGHVEVVRVLGSYPGVSSREGRPEGGADR